jgi:hypothetical protein
MFKMAYVTVGYIPTADPPKPGTKILIDPILSRNFEEMLVGGMPINADVFGKRTTVDSRCRSQILSSAGITDYTTAETLVRFYEAIQNKDWSALEDLLSDDFVYQVPDTICTFNEANRKDLFIEGLQRWTGDYSETLFDVEWSNIWTDRGMVRLNIVCEGKIIHEALVDYHFDLIGDEVRLTAISNFNTVNDIKSPRCCGV